MKESEGFQHHDSKYISKMACCGTTHCTKAAWTFFTISLLFLTCGIIFTFIKRDTVTYVLASITFPPEILGLVFLYFAMTRRNCFLVVPMIVAIVIGLIVISTLVLSLFLMIISLDSESGKWLLATTRVLLSIDHDYNREMTYFTLWVHAVSQLFLIVTQLWFIGILRRCYSYFKDYQEHRRLFGTRRTIECDDSE